MTNPTASCRLGSPRVLAFRHFGRNARLKSFILLEIMVALTLLLFGMCYIGGQVNMGYFASRESEYYYRAVMLAQAKIAEIDTGQVYIESSAYSAMEPEAGEERLRNVWEVSVEEEMEGVFGRAYPQYGWRLIVEPAADENILFFELKIYYEHSRISAEGEDFDFDDDIRPIFVVRFLRIIPKPLDFTADFGMSEEEADKLQDKIADSGVDLDPRNFDPSMLRDLPMEDLIAILPSILPALGMSIDDLAGMLPQEYLDMLNDAVEDDSEDESGDDAGSQDDGSSDTGGNQNNDGGGTMDGNTGDGGSDNSGRNPGRPGRRPQNDSADDGSNKPGNEGGGRPERPGRPGRR